MNRNAHLLMQEAQEKRSQMIENKPSITVSVSADSIFSHKLADDDQMCKLNSMSELSEKILSDSNLAHCQESSLVIPSYLSIPKEPEKHIENDEKIVNHLVEPRIILTPPKETECNYLVKPSVKLSRQVEHFGKMIHERNVQFVNSVRVYNREESFYFDDEDILAIERKTFTISSVDEVLEPGYTNPNYDVDSLDKSLTRKVSMEEHAKWNTFLKDISQLTIEIDDESEEFL